LWVAQHAWRSQNHSEKKSSKILKKTDSSSIVLFGTVTSQVGMNFCKIATIKAAVEVKV